MASLQTENNTWKSYMPLLGLVGLALVVRILLLPYTNYDTDGYSRWYEFIVRNGIQPALGQNFAIYTPPYLYLLSLATFSRSYIPQLIAIKLIPIFFDLVNALLIYKILRLKYRAGNLPVLASAVFLLAPTVIMNSALWGQVDSFYTCFLLASLFLQQRDCVRSKHFSERRWSVRKVVHTATYKSADLLLELKRIDRGA